MLRNDHTVTQELNLVNQYTQEPQGQESSQAGGKNMTEFSSIRRL